MPAARKTCLSKHMLNDWIWTRAILGNNEWGGNQPQLIPFFINSYEDSISCESFYYVVFYFIVCIIECRASYRVVMEQETHMKKIEDFQCDIKNATEYTASNSNYSIT